MAIRNKTEQFRQQIIDATDTLMYQKGFNLTSFSDIAQLSGVPRGNIYYYFKTKEDILDAVISKRVVEMEDMLEEWNIELSSPVQKIKRFIKIAQNEAPRLIRYGCPIGSLSMEISKALPDKNSLAKIQFDVFKQWLVNQFKLLDAGQDAEQLAIHVLVRSQGIAVLAQAYSDPEIVDHEVEQLYQWIDSLI